MALLTFGDDEGGIEVRVAVDREGSWPCLPIEFMRVGGK